MENLTLFITAFNRRETLDSLLPTLEGAPFDVVLLDSSSTAWEKRDVYPWVEYRHYPDALIYRVLLDAALTCKTDYLLWDNDDDLVSVEGALKCLRVIEAEPKIYSNVMGWQVKDGTDYGVKGAHYWLSNQKPHNTIAQRLTEMFKYFHSPVHSVMPKEVLTTSCEIVLQNPEYLPIRYFDRVVGIVQAIYGNKHFVNTPYLNRSHARLISGATYPEILERDKIPRSMLDVLSRNNPFARLVFRRERTPVQENNIMIQQILDTYVV